MSEPTHDHHRDVAPLPPGTLARLGNGLLCLIAALVIGLMNFDLSATDQPCVGVCDGGVTALDVIGAAAFLMALAAAAWLLGSALYRVAGAAADGGGDD